MSNEVISIIANGFLEIGLYTLPLMLLFVIARKLIL